MSCIRQTEECRRLKTNYEGHCFDPDQSFMNVKIITPVLKSLDNLMSILLENTYACVEDGNVEKTLECIRLRSSAQAYLLNCTNSRSDFVKKCAPSILVHDESRPVNCRKFDRAHQKALRVYSALWFECIFKTISLYDEVTFNHGPSPSESRILSELAYVYVDTMRIFQDQIRELLTNVHPALSFEVISRRSSTLTDIDDLPGLEDDDKPEPGDDQPFSYNISSMRMHFKLTAGDKEATFSVSTMRRLMSAAEMRMPLVITVLNTVCFLESNQIMHLDSIYRPLQTFFDGGNRPLVESYLLLPSSRILLVQLMMESAGLMSVSHIEPTDSLLHSNFSEMLKYPSVICFFNRSINHWSIQNSNDVFQATTFMRLLFSLDYNIPHFIMWLAEYILTYDTSTWDAFREYERVRDMSMSRRKRLLETMERNTSHLKQRGQTMFQLRSDFKVGDDALRGEHYWVDRQGRVMSLFRGDETVSDDGAVTIKCSQRPKKGVWKYVFIPGLNDSYVDRVSSETDEEIMHLVPERRNPGVLPKPSLVLEDTWTFTKDIEWVIQSA